MNNNGDARTWWKKIWKLTGKKNTSINLIEQGSGLKLEDKDAANMINLFFADLTNDFPDGHRMVGSTFYLLLQLIASPESSRPSSLTKLQVQMTRS